MSCSASPSATTSSRTSAIDAVRDSVIAGLREYAAAAAAFDSARVMALLADDPSFRFVDGQTFHTREGFSQLVSDAFSSLQSFSAHFNYDSLVVVELAPTAAVAIVPYVDVMRDRGGTETTVRGVVTWVWAVRDNRWRLVAGHAAPISPEVAK